MKFHRRGISDIQSLLKIHLNNYAFEGMLLIWKQILNISSSSLDKWLWDGMGGS